MIFEDRIQVNPRLFRLKDPRTNEIIDFEIQDLEPEEIIQEGTEITAENLNEQIVNEYSESTSNVYSTNYINNRLTPISLYHNDSGTSGAVTFSQSLPNDYKYIDIIFTGNNNTTDVTRVYDISKRANLLTANCNAQATTIWLQTETIQVTTTGITRGVQAEVAFASGGGVPAPSTVLIKDVYAFV